MVLDYRITGEKLCLIQYPDIHPETERKHDMTPEFITSYFMEAIKTAIMLAGPMLMVGLVVGIIVSMFQAATQINEMTLVFVPKMIGVALALLVFFPWMLRVISDFSQNMFANLPMYIR
jgi:flagellar biosynthetic protein FliQ